MPALIQAPFELRLLGFYRRLQRIEKAAPHGDTDTLLTELADLDRESLRLWVPRRAEASFFEFRQNVHDLRERLSATPPGAD